MAAAEEHPYDFDLIVIGSGPSGQKAAIQAAKLGRRVAVIERRERVGGVSIHTGTIPSKTLREAVLELVKRRSIDTASSVAPTGEWDGAGAAYLNDRAARVVAQETAVVREQLRRNHITLSYGEARFLDPHTIEVVDGSHTPPQHSAARIVIAVGRSPPGPTTSTSTIPACWTPTGSSPTGSCRGRSPWSAAASSASSTRRCSRARLPGHARRPADRAC
jgi:NAD(P) transhydrogenase